MNVRALLGLSLLVNAALVVVGWQATGRGPAAAAAAEPAAATQALRVRTNLTRIELTETNEAAPFHWRDVQAEDLREFVANLRGIGCPPETVRAVIESELWARFLPRRRALLEPFHRQYWDLMAMGPDVEKASKPVREAVEKLKEETIERLDELVGKAPPKQEKPGANRQTDFLPESTQRALEDLEKKISEEIGKVRPEKGGKMTPELQAKRDELQAQRKAAIRALMTPEEYAEYELRQSRYASTAPNVVGFDATAEDLRVITRIYQQFEAADARQDRKDPDAAMKKAQAAEARRQREEALKEALSPERYAQFQEGMEGGFQQIYGITRRYELPRATASAAAGVLKAREEAMRQLRGDKAQDTEERARRELAVQVEARKALLGVLGGRALRTYEKYHGPVIPVPKNEPQQ